MVKFVQIEEETFEKLPKHFFNKWIQNKQYYINYNRVQNKIIYITFYNKFNIGMVSHEKVINSDNEYQDILINKIIPVFIKNEIQSLVLNYKRITKKKLEKKLPEILGENFCKNIEVKRTKKDEYFLYEFYCYFSWQKNKYPVQLFYFLQIPK